jgi:Ca-activated chloride channel family protein
MDVRFFQLQSLHWLWVVLALAAVAGWSLWRRERLLRRLVDASLIGRLAPRRSRARPRLRAAVVIVALVALVAAMLDPRWGVRYEDVHHRGIDVIFAIDVSRSMLAEDARPSRLERARQCVADALEALRGDRAGLLTFAGDAAIRAPLTVDYGALRLALDEVAPQAAARGGSNLGDAIRIAAQSFTDDVRDHKAIVLLSDGEDHGSYPVEAARQAFSERGIRVYTVGLGDAHEGSRIPVPEGGQRRFLLHEGREVWSKMDTATLRDMALAGGGAFVPAGTSSVDFGQLYEDRIEPTVAGRDLEARRVRRYTARYQWFAGLALLLLLVETFMSDRRAAALSEVLS